MQWSAVWGEPWGNLRVGGEFYFWATSFGVSSVFYRQSVRQLHRWHLGESWAGCRRRQKAIEHHSGGNWRRQNNHGRRQSAMGCANGSFLFVDYFVVQCFWCALIKLARFRILCDWVFRTQYNVLVPFSLFCVWRDLWRVTFPFFEFSDTCESIHRNNWRVSYVCTVRSTCIKDGKQNVKCKHVCFQYRFLSVCAAYATNMCILCSKCFSYTCTRRAKSGKARVHVKIFWTCSLLQ